MNFWQYILLFGIVIGGGAMAFVIRRNRKRMLQIILSFTGAYILGVTVLHLMPTVFSDSEEITGLWVLAGFLLQLLLEQLSGGVEHGHIHAAHGPRWRFAITVMLGLSLHAFLEGMPLANYQEFHTLHHDGHNHGHQHLLIGIILHKAPAAFALVALLISSGFHRLFIWIALIFFSLMSPLGAALTDLAAWSANIQLTLLALVIGSFLHISTTILFETDSSSHHRISWNKLTAIIIGLSLSALTLFL